MIHSKYNKDQKVAQIDVLNLVMNNLCGAELTRSGREEIGKIIKRIQKDLDNGNYNK